MIRHLPTFSFFFFNDTATTEIYTLSLHDALPIYQFESLSHTRKAKPSIVQCRFGIKTLSPIRSEEHTSELQSQSNLVCRLLLEKKKKKQYTISFDSRTVLPHPVKSHTSLSLYS